MCVIELLPCLCLSVCLYVRFVHLFWASFYHVQLLGIRILAAFSLIYLLCLSLELFATVNFGYRMGTSSRSSFFMYCFGDFSSKLSIPTAFADEYPEFLGQAFVELKTGTGRSWDVKIKRMNSNKWFITDGWSEFMTDNKLVELNLLTFRISGESTLDVSIFRNDSCLDEPHSPSQEDDDEDDDDDDDDTSTRTWRFVRKIKVYHVKGLRLDIPKSFINGTGITTSCNTELQNVHGGRWPVTVSDRRIGVYSFTRGWNDFVKDNDVQVGSFLLFEFVKNSNKVIKVITLENQVGKRLYAQKRRGGLV